MDKLIDSFCRQTDHIKGAFPRRNEPRARQNGPHFLETDHYENEYDGGCSRGGIKGIRRQIALSCMRDLCRSLSLPYIGGDPGLNQAEFRANSQLQPTQINDRSVEDADDRSDTDNWESNAAAIGTDMRRCVGTSSQRACRIIS